MTKNTTTPRQPVTGPGRFQWSGAGWAGTTLGGPSVLLPVMAFLSCHDQTTLAILALVAFLILTMTGIVLWRLRHSIYPFSALMYFLSLYALLVPAVLLVIGELARADALSAMNWPNTAMTNAVVVLLAPLVILATWFAEYRSRAKPKQKIAD